MPKIPDASLSTRDDCKLRRLPAISNKTALSLSQALTNTLPAKIVYNHTRISEDFSILVVALYVGVDNVYKN